jgi:hypothetical protein
MEVGKNHRKGAESREKRTTKNEMEAGREPQIIRWKQEEIHREWDGSRERTTDNEMEAGREPQRMRWKQEENTENEMEVGREPQRRRWK